MTVLIKGEKKLLFLHIPKCGGSSVVDSFKENGYSSELEMRGRPPQKFFLASPQHQSCNALKGMVDFNGFNNIFALIRNPYERIKSEFNWNFRNEPINKRPDFNKWVIDSIENALINSSYEDNHFRPMVQFFDKDVPAFIFKLEDGLEIVYEYFLHINNSPEVVKTLHCKDAKTFKYRNSTFNFNNDAIALINYFYEDDFKAFEYDFIETNDKVKLDEKYEFNKKKDELYDIRTLKKWRTDTLIKIVENLLIKISCFDESLDKKDKYNDNESLLNQKDDLVYKLFISQKTLYEEIPTRLEFVRQRLMSINANESNSIYLSRIYSLMNLLGDFRNLFSKYD